MRCKKGDIAIVVGGRTGLNLGEEVTCLAFVGMPEFLSSHEDCWRIDKSVMWSDGINRPYCPDSCLMPIKPDSKETQTDFKVELTQEKDVEHG